MAKKLIGFYNVRDALKKGHSIDEIADAMYKDFKKKMSKKKKDKITLLKKSKS